MRAQLLCAAAILALLTRASGVWAQGTIDDGSISIVFHVTSVAKEEPPDDYCTTGKCIAERFIVKGYSRVQGDIHYTQFVLRCIEINPVHPTEEASWCPRLRANVTYDAKLFGDAVIFVDHGSKQPKPPFDSGFDIVSQREIATPK